MTQRLKNRDGPCPLHKEWRGMELFSVAFPTNIFPLQTMLASNTQPWVIWAWITKPPLLNDTIRVGVHTYWNRVYFRVLSSLVKLSYLKCSNLLPPSLRIETRVKCSSNWRFLFVESFDLSRGFVRQLISVLQCFPLYVVLPSNVFQLLQISLCDKTMRQLGEGFAENNYQMMNCTIVLSSSHLSPCFCSP